MSTLVRKHIPTAEFDFKEDGPPFYLVHTVDDSRIREEFNLTRQSLEKNVEDQIRMVQEAEGLKK